MFVKAGYVLLLALLGAAPPAVHKVRALPKELGKEPYIVSCALSAADLPLGEAAGLVFGLKGGRDFRLAWIERDGVRLLEQADGAWKELAASRGPHPAGAASWSVFWSPDRVVVARDGRPRLVWNGATSGEGRVGSARSSGAPEPGDLVVHPAPAPVLSDNFQATDDKLAAWTPSAGRWRVDAIQDSLLRRDGHPPKVSRYRGSDGRPAVSLTGRPTWCGHVAEVAAQFLQPRPAGVVFAYRDEKNYGYLTFRPAGDTGEAVLGALVDGADRVVARKLLPAVAGAWYRLRVENDPERVRGFVGHVEVGAGVPVGPVFGKCGLLVGPGGDAVFDDFTVEPITPEALGAAQRRWCSLFRTGFSILHIPGERQQEMHYVLGDILRPEGPGRWQVSNAGGNPRLCAPAGSRGRSGLWYYRDIRGDVSLSVNARLTSPAPGAAGQAAPRLGLAIAADERGAGGYELLLTPHAAELRRGSDVLDRRDGLRLTDAVAVRLWRAGRELGARVGDLALRSTDAAPLEGGRVGLWAEGPVEVDDLEVGNGLGAAYRFENVETDWRPGAGKWVEHSGMTCIAWDHWIGAQAEPEALLWNAFVWPDHTTASVWVSEATEGEETGYHVHFPCHSIQFIIGGNGSDSKHGYRFLIAGGPGKNVTQLFRNGKVVAETRQFAIWMGGHNNEPRTFLITVRREGAQISLWIDERLLLSYTDAQPLGSGQIGFGCVGCRADFKDFTAFVDKPWLDGDLPAKW